MSVSPAVLITCHDCGSELYSREWLYEANLKKLGWGKERRKDPEGSTLVDVCAECRGKK